MAGFIQIIEYTTSRADEVKALNESWRERFPEMGPSRVTVVADRDRANTFLAVVEFESYEAAMRNSADPATTEYAERMMALCDGPAVFRNLDLVSTEIRTPSQRRPAPSATAATTG
jgi:hypothetical protein